jgi:membrane-bound ClpP family serine protease
MLTSIVTGLIIGWILLELLEHLVFPVIWYIATRKQASPCSPESMVGQEVIVKHWQGTQGQVWINGELWKAASDEPLQYGDKATVQEIRGLRLKIAPVTDHRVS